MRDSTVQVINKKPEIGLQISKIFGENEKIACWPTKDGSGWFTKIDWSEEKKVWYPVTNPRYRGRGLVVFLSSKIEGEEDFLEITGHGKGCVFGDVLYH